MLETQNLRSGYGEMEILHGVSMTLDEREMIALIGPNGAGKSTLIKTIFGLLRPTEGRVLFRDKDITAFHPRDLVMMGLGYVPQTNNTFPMFPNLQPKLREPAGSLSGGEQQMVALAKSMMLDPDVLLIDEPSAGLAPKLVDTVFSKIAEINEGGTGVVMVEQNAKKALAIADRGYVLETGRNRFAGTGEWLLHNADVGKLYLGGQG